MFAICEIYILHGDTCTKKINKRWYAVTNYWGPYLYDIYMNSTLILIVSDKSLPNENDTVKTVTVSIVLTHFVTG